MPLYEYICQDCGTRFDALRQFRDADQVIACKNCQSQKTVRQLSAFFAQSSGKIIAGTGGGCNCGGCSGGNCAGCSH